MRGPHEWDSDAYVPEVSLITYAVFIVSTLFCSANGFWEVCLLASCLASTLIKLHVRVRRLGEANELRPMRSPLLRELISVVQLLCITMLPAMLASFGGGSAAFMGVTGSVARDCRVDQLPALALLGYDQFECQDGFVATNMQTVITTALDLPEESHKKGFVAPIFASRAAQLKGEAPVAWAVKVGSKVHEPWCDGTCGFFALQLQQRFAALPAPRTRFGEAWGFGLKDFSEDDMRAAAGQVRTAQGWPTQGYGAGMETFVVTEMAWQYFGPGYVNMFVMLTLLGVGLLDRLHILMDARVHVRQEEGPRDYNALMLQTAEEKQPESGLAEQAAGFWTDPLSTSKMRAGTEFWRSSRGVST